MSVLSDTIIVPSRFQATNWQWISGGLLLLLLTGACQDNRNPLRSYYFPIEDCREGQVYVYASPDDPGLPVQIWLLESTPGDSGWILQTRIYDQSHTLLQVIREREVANGMLALSYQRYLRDTSGQERVRPLEVLRGNLFPFQIPDTSRVFTFQLRYREPDDSTVVTTRTRYRRFKGMDQIHLADGDHPSLVFGLQERIEIEEEGVMTLDFHGEEVYARHIGLAAWLQVPAPGDTILYLLRERYSRRDFEKAHGPLE
jgi:hypothetical protein